MPESSFGPKDVPMSGDLFGDAAAVTCPVCGKVFIVRGSEDGGRRTCPVCGKAAAAIAVEAGESRVSVEW